MNEPYFPTIPLENVGKLYKNTPVSQLIEQAIQRHEGEFSSSGALVVKTGRHTGRSAQDKFVVRDAITEDTVWWDNTKAISPGSFDILLQDFTEHLEGKEVFVQDLYAGADPAHRLSTRVITEYAWHALFIRNLLRRPDEQDLESFEAEFTIINLPSFQADVERHGVRTDTVIACDFTRKLVLIGGTSYAGEIKKSVFSYLNFSLPEKAVMPMHCSANVGQHDDVAVFFGLSGTGKTTLSADPKRTLLGDDEHGWSENGVYNFEGGCYAKTINLCANAEPEIYAASNKFGTVLENVVLHGTSRQPDFCNNSLTENTRSAYPLHYIANASSVGQAGHPKNIIMLTADAFGVLPPIAKLTPDQAMYHFLSGYTAKVAGTEKGVDGVSATFSTCFGAPFMPRHPCDYGNLLRDLIAEHNVDCWLVNTGWTAGAYGVGHRMPIAVTRALLDAVLTGALKQEEMCMDTLFGFEVPMSVEGVEKSVLTPRETWDDPHEYDIQAHQLVKMFRENFRQFEEMVDSEVCLAAPVLSQAAE
ncbi:MAG: phosphoenolpyruvate carboxykinase [Pseudomonadota bacterium]